MKKVSLDKNSFTFHKKVSESFNVGDSVTVIGNHICFAPLTSIGESGVVAEVLDGVVDGILYKRKCRVLFPDVIKETYNGGMGYRDWLYDYDELTSSGD